MEKALSTTTPQGFRRRQSLGRPLTLAKALTAAEVKAVVEATYRQLLNRQP
jgi:phycobilisome core-membrane linker protein